MFARSMFIGVLVASVGWAGAANAQCPTGQLDYDFRLGIFDDILGNVLVDPGTGENLWTGDMGSTPLWTTIPGQTSANFVDADNDGNGIDDDDHLDLLAAIVDGGGAGGAVLNALQAANPGAVAAIQAAYAANVAAVQTIELTLQNVEIDSVINDTVTVTTGSNLNALSGLVDTDIPSLWGINESSPSDGLLYAADGTGVLEQSLIEILAGVMTIGDPAGADYVQALIAQVMVAVIDVVLPDLLNNLKSLDGAPLNYDLPGGVELYSPGGSKAFSVNCSVIAPFDYSTTYSGFDVDIHINAQYICNALQAFIDNFNCTKFDCQGALLQATGNLNGTGGNNLATYTAAANRQAWMGSESILNPPLEITSHTMDTTVTAGDETTFEMDFVEGLSGGPQEFRWHVANLADFSLGAIIATTEEHVIEYSLPADSGNYIGTVCDSLWTRKTLPFNLAVNVAAFGVTQQPAAASIAVGDDHTLSVKVNGGTVVPTYQWQKGAAMAGPFANVPSGGTSKSLDFTNAQIADSGFYRVQITGGSKAVITSNVVQLQVLPPIVISAQPAGANLVVGESHALAVTASGGSGALVYQWQRDPTETGSSFANVSGATSDTLSLSPALISQQGLYRCRVRDSAVPPQQVFTNQVLVTVLGFNVAPPLNSSVAVGGNLTLTALPGGGLVSAPGNPAVDYTYSWTKAPGPNPSSTTNEVAIVAATLADGGAYNVTVTDLAGRMATSAPANVFVTNSPIIIGTHPVDTGRAAGSSVSFTCAATGGVGALSFEWFFDNGGGPASLGAGTAISGGSQLSIAGLTQVANEGVYFCRVSDGGSPQVADSNNAQLYVGTPVVFQGGTGPVGGDFHTGDSHVLDVLVTGGIGPLTFDWRQNGAPVGPNSDVYDLSPVTPLNIGTFECVISDVGAGDAVNGFTPNTITSASVVVRVGPPLQLLSNGQPQGQTVSSGANVTFTVAPIGGLGVLSYQWFRDAKAPLAGEISDSLTLTGVDDTDEGDYFCQIVDELGGPMGDVTSGQASLVVADPLVVTQHPLDVEGSEGDGAFMGVGVSGGLTQSYAYQWRKDNVNIAGATNNVLSFSPLAASDLGSYDCVVTDSTESVVSNAATVTIAASGLPVAGGLGIAVLVALMAAIGARRKKK